MNGLQAPWCSVESAVQVPTTADDGPQSQYARCSIRSTRRGTTIAGTPLFMNPGIGLNNAIACQREHGVTDLARKDAESIADQYRKFAQNVKDEERKRADAGLPPDPAKAVINSSHIFPL